MKNLKAAMMTSISSVLETMFFMSTDFSVPQTRNPIDLLQSESAAACQLEFSGPLSGSFLLVIPETLLVDMAVNFMGLEPEEIGSPQREGTIKELVNMIAGNTFSTLNNQVEFQLAIPELVDAREITLQTSAENEIELLTETTGGCLAVKVILRDTTRQA